MRWLILILLLSGCASYPLPQGLNVSGATCTELREWKSTPPAWNEAVNYLYFPKADFLICAGKVKDGRTNNRQCAKAAWIIAGETRDFGFPLDLTKNGPLYSVGAD